MRKRKPELWETSAPGPFITMPRERGTVTVWALGRDRFRVEAQEVSHELEGFEAARALAGRLAAQLGAAAG
jgi:hypothetical protein